MECTHHVKLNGELLKKFNSYRKKERRSANFIIKEALTKFLNKTNYDKRRV